MVKRLFLLVVLSISLFGCDRKLRHLTLEKIPYDGDELRIDGYYYSTPEPTGSTRVAILYENGFCIHTRLPIPVDADIFEYIENEFLLNKKLIDKLKRIPMHIGVFQIHNPDIEIAVWEDRTMPATYSGEIENDTTFVITKFKNNRTGKVIHENLTYRFVEFSPLPDPSNGFVRSIILEE